MERLAKEFESFIDQVHDEEDNHHNEQKQSVQISFDVTPKVELIDEVGNTSLEDSNQLLVLDTKK